MSELNINTMRDFLNSNIKDNIHIQAIHNPFSDIEFELQLKFNIRFKASRQAMNNDLEILKYMTENAEYELTRKVQETALKMLPEPLLTQIYDQNVILSPFYPDGSIIMHPSTYNFLLSDRYIHIEPIQRNVNKSNCRW